MKEFQISSNIKEILINSKEKTRKYNFVGSSTVRMLKKNQDVDVEPIFIRVKISSPS